MADPSEGILQGPAGDVFVRGDNAYFFTKEGKVTPVPRANIGVALEQGMVPMKPGQVYEHDRVYELERQAQTAGGQTQAAIEGVARAAGDTLLAPARAAAAVVGIDQSNIPKTGDLLTNFYRDIDPSQTRGSYEENMRLRADTTAGRVAPLAFDAATIPLGGLAAKGMGVASTLGRVAMAQAIPGALSGGQMATEDAWRRNVEVDPTDLLTSMGMGALISGGLGTLGHYGGNAIRKGTSALMEGVAGGAPEALRTGARVLRGVSQYSDLMAPTKTFGGARRLVTGKLASLMDTAATLAGRGARTAEEVMESGAMRAAQREIGAAERIMANAARAEEALSSSISRVDEGLASRVGRLQSSFEAETARVAKSSTREAASAARDIQKYQTSLSRAQEAMERSSAEAIPAISAAEAKLEKATAREAALVKRGAPREQLQAARAEVQARRYALDGVQEKYAAVERGHQRRISLAREGIDEAKGRAKAAQEAVTSGAEQRQARLTEQVKAEQEAANIKRQQLLDKRETVRAELSGARSAAQGVRVKMDEALATAMAPKAPTGLQKALGAVVRPVGAGAEKWARVGFRPYPLAAAGTRLGDAYDAHSDTPSKNFAQQQRDTKQLMDRAIQAAAGSGVRWRPISGVGDYENYPHGQFIYPGETRRQAFENRQKELAQMLTNPGSVVEKLGAGVGADLASISPQAYQQVTLTVMRALDWLGRFQYGVAQPSNDPFRPYNTKAAVSDGDIAQFERLWNATMFPGVLADQLAQWRLDRDTISTAATVHPEMLNGIRAAISNSIITGQMKPTYQQRLQLSELFGLPIAETLPQTQAMLQMAFAQKAQADAASGPTRPPGRPEGSPTLAQQYRTVSQQSADPGR